MSRVSIVTSIPSPHSRLDQLHRTVHDMLGVDHDVDTISLGTLPESVLLTGNTDDPAVRASKRVIENSDGVVVINPSYAFSCSPLLRSWVDTLAVDSLRGTVVQAIGVGSTWAQASGVDYGMRKLFAERGADEVLPAAFVFDKWFEPESNGWRPGHFAITTISIALSAFHVGLDRNALVAA